MAGSPRLSVRETAAADGTSGSISIRGRASGPEPSPLPRSSAEKRAKGGLLPAAEFGKGRRENDALTGASRRSPPCGGLADSRTPGYLHNSSLPVDRCFPPKAPQILRRIPRLCASSAFRGLPQTPSRGREYPPDLVPICPFVSLVYLLGAATFRCSSPGAPPRSRSALYRKTRSALSIDLVTVESDFEGGLVGCA